MKRVYKIGNEVISKSIGSSLLRREIGKKRVKINFILNGKRNYEAKIMEKWNSTFPGKVKVSKVKLRFLNK